MFAGLIKLALGYQHSMILMQDGSVWTTAATIPDADISAHGIIYSKNFVRVVSSGATAVAAGNAFGMALKQDGSVLAMGDNNRCQLGTARKDIENENVFFFVQIIARAKAAACGGCHSLIVTQEGQVWATGWNKYGQIGSGSPAYKIMSFAEIASEATAMAAGDVHSMILKQDGQT